MENRKKAFYNLLQFKIHLGIQFILIACFLGLGYFIFITQLNFLLNDIKSQGAKQVDMVAASSVVAIERQSYYILEDLATKAEYSPLVAFCEIEDASGKSFLQTMRGGLPRADLMKAYGPEDVLLVTRDIVGGSGKLGTVKLGMFVDKARTEVQKTTVQLVAAFAAVLGVIAVFLYFFLNRLLISPVVNLSLLTETLSRGEFVTTNLDRRRDELGTLASGFNNMSRNLKELYKTLEKKVDARTEDLNNAYSELQAIFDNSLVGIAVMTPDHRILRANDRFASIFGYSVQDMPLLSPDLLHVSEEAFVEFVETYYNNLSEADITQLEYQFRRKNGTPFWSQVSAKAFDRDDLSKGIILVLEDVTDRKKASEMLREHAEDLRLAKEQADKATRSKSEFLARMSHEIRTPMNAILGMAEMLQDTGLSEEQQEYVKTFSSAGELLLGIINDILDFSKIEVGQIKLEEISFNLRDLVDDVTKLFVYRAEEKSITLKQSVAEDLSSRFIGDPTRIRQILINLLGNAVKFTHTGGVSLSVRESNLEDGSPCCLFAVKDSGVGIAQAKQAVIFESFAQADSSTTREFGGTGLGLAISKKLVELMGGKIWVESEVNSGTTFYFKLPLVPDYKETESETPLSLPVDTRLLVVEETPDQADGLTASIRRWGVLPTVVGSASDAVDLLSRVSSEEEFQVVLIAARVDGESSVQVAQLLLGQNLELPGLLLVVAGEDEVAGIPDDPEFGIVSYLLQSDMPHGLAEKIKFVLDGMHRKRMSSFDSKAWRVLLVDDVEANRKVVELFLKDSNVELVTAENGKIAVEKFTDEYFDLVLMDMEMPVMDGLEATRRIRLWEDEKREYRTPILALTAHAFQEHRQKTMDAGCTEFLAKPIKKQALIKAIESYAGRRDSMTPVVPGQSDVQTIGALVEHDSPVQIDPELEDLRPLFLRTVHDFQTQIADAITAEDYSTIQRCGHSLKGLGSTYAVDEISQAGRIIETAAKSGQAAVITEALNHLATFMSTGATPKIQTEQEPESSNTGNGESPGRYAVRVAPEMSELIPFLMDAMQKDLEMMNKALASDDYSALRRFGHSHKGFGSTYGFDYITSLGSQIERVADARDHEKMESLLAALGDYLERVDIIYDNRQDLNVQDFGDPGPGVVVEENAFAATDYIVEVDAELYELVPLFLDTMRTNIEEMREGLNDRNFDVVCRHGHSQKGLGSTYGFDYLGQLGYRIESAGLDKNEDELRALLDEMSEYLTKVRIVQREG